MYENPFELSIDPDRNTIWDILIRRDTEAFIANDWSLIESNFDKNAFYGVDAFKSKNPDDWKIKYATLSEYRDQWLMQRSQFNFKDFDYDGKKELLAAMKIASIEIRGDLAIAHKKFNGIKSTIESGDILLNWQTLYYLSKSSGEWKVIGFTGYMPYETARNCKHIPTTAKQHITAGPYSPVLEVRCDKLVVISGQAAIDFDGSIKGETIEEQARYTIENCIKQLSSAGAVLSDVFKVNVYLADVSEWERFNDVYKEMMPSPFPVRTAVQVTLLSTLKVEIEMWAMLSN